MKGPIAKDPNAVLALNRLSEIEYGRPFDKLPKCMQDQFREQRLRSFMEQGEAKVAQEAGTFICEAGYAFKTIVDQCEHYRIYRCDGGHHYGVVFVEHKERGGSAGIERRLVYRNGELVIEEGIGRNEDQLGME